MRNHKRKILRVIAFPQNSSYVPSVRIAGNWLEMFGFAIGDQVQIKSRKGNISIKKLNSIENENSDDKATHSCSKNDYH